MNAIINALSVKCDELTTEQLLEIVRKLNLSFDEAEENVGHAATNVLRTRLSETDFIALMDELEAEIIAA